ncbi:MAG: hypothetical protein CL840_00205 [Crocinitomicaceae bacterium]|nr:hypothetical protein [Crocinitomicaceae bacterium]|tara:strand:+ start:4922 stop:5524 length:603 start_codon:yes stop_codon:yes gene_type:complete
MEETKTIASNELLMEQLQNRDWDQFWLRLMGRCFWLLRKRYTVKWGNDEVKNFSRKAIGEVINKIFIEKKRNWNIDRYPDFEEFIVGVIDSHVNNTLNKEDKDFTVGDNEFLLDENGESEPDAQEIVITQELRNQIYDELDVSGADDDELLIFECLADGMNKPDDIKNELGMSDEDFHNAWRRFKRKRKTIQKKLGAYGY